MSAAAEVRAALLAAVRAAVAGRVNGVFEGAAAQATPPFVEVADSAQQDWGTKTHAGREIRVAVTVRDAGETPARAEALAEAVEQALAAMPRDLPHWRVAGVALMRARTGMEGRGRWSAMVDHRFRLLAKEER